MCKKQIYRGSTHVIRSGINPLFISPLVSMISPESSGGPVQCATYEPQLPHAPPGRMPVRIRARRKVAPAHCRAGDAHIGHSRVETGRAFRSRESECCKAMQSTTRHGHKHGKTQPGIHGRANNGALGAGLGERFSSGREAHGNIYCFPSSFSPPA